VILGAVVASALATNDSAGGGGSSHRLHVDATVVAQGYCSEASDSEVALLDMRYQLRITNLEERPLIIARQLLGPVRWDIATDVAAAEVGRLEVSVSHLSLLDRPSGRSRPRVRRGVEPDEAQFTVVAPGGVGESTAIGAIQVTRSGKAIPGIAIGQGSNHAIRVTVSLWPFLEWQPEQVDELRRTWSSTGELVTGTAESSFIPFTAPPMGAHGKCTTTDSSGS
jgi:hypothetical protein